MQTMDIIAEDIDYAPHAAFIFGDYDEININSTMRNDYSPAMVNLSQKKML